MKTVAQVSRLTGISVRTLHHYDAIGLLRPTKITDSGYRLYDEEALKRLHSILLLRKLQFPLKEIRSILDSPDYDPVQALEEQIRLLELQRDQLDTLIAHARQIQKTGVISMNFQPFDTKKMDQYAEQAKQKWGKTQPYLEYEEKTAGTTKDALQASGAALMDIFRRFGEIRHLSPADIQVQALVETLQRFITEHYYTCTKPILKGLGQMYIAGDEMTQNIDKAGGAGTADFAHQAIEIFCK